MAAHPPGPAPTPEPVDLLAPRPIEPYRLVTADGLELGAWLVRGEPGHPCVLLLHGNGGSPAWRPLLQELVGQGHCVLAVSLRAHGDSDWEGGLGRHAQGGCVASPPARLTARPAPVSGPPRPLRTSPPPPHGLSPAYTRKPTSFPWQKVIKPGIAG